MAKEDYGYVHSSRDCIKLSLDRMWIVVFHKSLSLRC